ncbi:hypothetical protein ACS0TY_020531 [Phlomoides rotata]
MGSKSSGFHFSYPKFRVPEPEKPDLTPTSRNDRGVESVDYPPERRPEMGGGMGALHHDIDVDKTYGVGPGMAFSNSILKRESGVGVIGLVPCAVGGMNISECAQTSISAQTRDISAQTRGISAQTRGVSA